MIDPIVWMNAAVVAVGNGEAGEIELTLTEERLDGVEMRLTMAVRKDVQHINFNRGDEDGR